MKNIIKKQTILYLCFICLSSLISAECPKNLPAASCIAKNTEQPATKTLSEKKAVCCTQKTSCAAKETSASTTEASTEKDTNVEPKEKATAKETVAPKIISQKAAPKAAKTLTLDQAVREALIKKPSIHAFSYNVKNYTQQKKGVIAGFFPSVSASGTFYNTNNSSSAQDAFSVQVNQTIFNLSKVSEYRVLRAQEAAAKHEKEKHMDDIRFATETAFLNSWLLQQQLKLIVLLFSSSKENFEQADHQHKLNLLDKNDFLKAKATYSSSLSTVNAYEHNLSEAEKSIEYYIQTPISLLVPKKDFLKTNGMTELTSFFPTTLEWNHSKKITVEPFDNYYQKALQNRKDLKAKDRIIESKSATKNLYLASYVPSVGISGSATKTHFRPTGSSYSKEGKISASWSFGLPNALKYRAANADKMKSVLEKQDLEKQIKLEVQTAYSSLQKEINNLKAQTVSYQQAKNEFDLKQQENQSGLISPVAFQTAKYTYENARIAWLNQIVTTTLKERELQKVCGYPEKAAS